MALLIGIGDLRTHIYEEISQEISRGDDDLANKAISRAISKAKSFLGKYDLTALFGSEDADPTVKEDLLDDLKGTVTDLAAWYLIRLCNVNIDLTLFRTAYEDAISSLKLIQNGKADPDGWPYKPETNCRVDPGSSVSASSNRKRRNHW